ncbi:hypothetical protein ACFFWE_10060 [Sphaerisporangium melleum]|uniref:hypothetical protein n=1 Tax=Sphaerisporangium melleum TaxID=321316 RepID=UPI00166A0E44|nr:hypothetical protein [Sphaerisporangium melleum]
MTTWTGHAETLADTTALAAQAEHLTGRCRATGLDPRTYAGIIAATIALGAYPVNATGTPWPQDRDLIEGICDLLDDIADRWHDYIRLRHAAATERARARAHLNATSNPHDKEYLQAVVADCTTALDVLAPLAGRLRAASARLNDTPEQLGETYAAVYDLVARGGQMPRNGRWITGEDPSC